MRARHAELLATIVGRPLRAVRLDLASGAVEVRADGAGLRFEGVRSSTLLGPWDGAPAHVEACTLVHADDRQASIELRLRYPEVPRTYRLVCREVRRLDPL